MPGDDFEGEFDGTTWKKPRSSRRPAARTAVPCLTICAHADVQRIGQRAVLRGLLVRKPAQLSRLSPTFVEAGQDAGRPLDDPYVSRRPLTMRGDARRGIVLEGDGEGVVVGGAPFDGQRELSAEALAAGVPIELDERVLLWLHTTEDTEPTPMGELLGQADGIERVRREIAGAAELDVPVLIRGESGSGKEGVARQIHARSARRDGPFVPVNMATVPATTAVSTLFGHARGAFTGAAQKHVGLFEQAHGGTLFLDEIGETPDEVQPMLLRVLETGAITPLGETRERALDVRVVAATDADLDGGAREGSFRRALLHRLAAYEIPVPPLRQRREDLPALFVHFLRQELAPQDAPLLDAEPRSEDLPLPAALMAALLDHDFPGNVRELRNLARRMAVASRGADRLAADALLQWLARAQQAPRAEPSASTSPTAATQPPPRPSRRPAEIDDAALVAALEEHQWSPGRAAAALGIPTSTLHDLMRKSSAIRRAKDIGDDELAQALSATDGDPVRAAARLRVSERALRMTLKQRGKL